MDDQIISLWVAYKEHQSKQAKDELIIHFVSLVKTLAGKLYTNYRGNVEYDDLVGYGIIGLIDAIERFDYKKNVKFETYASIRIRGAIVDQLRQLDWIPRSIRSKYRKIEETIEQLQAELQGDVPDELVAATLNLSLPEYHDMLSEVTTYAMASLEEKIEENSNFDIPTTREEFQPETHLLSVELKERLLSSIDNLPEKERLVMSLYYYSDFTYKEIAAVLSVTESRVSQIHSKAISRLEMALSSLQ